eukprot:maker-scaffold18_size714446-snap-gene-1.17 protein:Tk08454 transcript:maker-scaffold18_size714446-snap-gene-1.17-mRNA-1 annotation:"vascular cell adhesion protein 1"
MAENCWRSWASAAASTSSVAFPIQVLIDMVRVQTRSSTILARSTDIVAPDTRHNHENVRNCRSTVNTRLFKLAREDKSVIVDYQDPNLNDKIQSVFHNAVCNPQNGTLTLRGIKLEDTGKWYCEQTIQDSTQQTTDTRIHQTAFFLDVQQQATIEISLATKEGLARCRSLGGYPKVSMRAVVSTDPTGTASTQELRAKRHASNVALNAEDTDFEFDPDQVPHEHYIVCIGEQFRQGRVVIRPTNYIQWRGPDYEHPSPAEESNVMLFSNSNEWVHGHSQNITCKQAGGLPESSLSIFLSEDQEGKRLLKTLDIVMEESFQESANLRTLVSRYNPNLTDENIFIVCQEQQSTGSDGTVTAIKDNIRIGNVKYAPTIEDKKNHYRIQANPLPGLEDISLWKCNDPDCQRPQIPFRKPSKYPSKSVDPELKLRTNLLNLMSSGGYICSTGGSSGSNFLFHALAQMRKIGKKRPSEEIVKCKE